MLDPALQPIIMIMTFIVGLCIGSFLNVMGLRLLANEDFILPASHCPKCKTTLRPIDNIPVLSYMLLGGKCHACKASISIQYPLIELATGILFCTTVWHFGLGWQTLFLLFFISQMIVIFITDLLDKSIYEINSLTLIPVGIVYNLLNLGHVQGSFPLDLGALVIHIPNALISALMGIAIAFIFFEGMILLSLICFGTDGFGHGDTHLMMGVGAFLGWPLTVLALILGFFAQTIPAVPMLVIQWIKNKQYVSLISGSLALIGGTAPLILMNMHLAPDLRMTISLVCLVASLIALIVFLKQVKSAQSYTYLPLGPALIIGVIVALFWGNQMIDAYQHYAFPHAAQHLTTSVN